MERTWCELRLAVVVVWAIIATSVHVTHVQRNDLVCYLKIKSSPGTGIKNLKKSWLNRAPGIRIPGIGLLSHNGLLSSWLD